MAEVTGGTPATTKKVTEYTEVTLTDGRVQKFAGKQRLKKESLFDAALINSNPDGSVTIHPGAISSRFDLLDGKTITVAMPPAMLAQFAAHGALQKYGDACASSAKEPLSEEDMYLAIEELGDQIAGGKWREVSEGGGASGAGVVVRALMAVSGKTAEEIKAFVDKKLAAYEAAGTKMTRKEYYSALRNAAGTPIALKIKELEDAEAAKRKPKVDVGDVSAELAAS